MRRVPYSIAVLVTLVAIAAATFFVAHQAHALTVTQIFNGGTGTSTPPAYGQVLVGGKSGEYELVSTSTFGGGGSSSGFSTTSANYWLTQQTTSGLAEGSNLYFTAARALADFITNLAATTSVASITTLSHLSLPYSQLTSTPTIPTLLSQLTNDVGFVTSSFSTTSANYWLTTNTTDNLAEGSTNLYFTNARADARFVTDLAATTSVRSITALPSLSLPYSQLTGAPTFDTFAYPFPSNATSTTLTFSGGVVSNGSTTIAGLSSGLVGDNNGKLYGIASSSADLPNSALQNSSITINSTTFNLGDTKTITAASSSLLGDTNTFSGTDTFNNTIHGSINGNANTATALAANGTNCASGFYAQGVDASGNAEGCAYLLATTTPWSNGGVVAINASGVAYDISTTSLNASITGNAGTVTNGVYTTSFGTLFDNRLSASSSISGITTLPNLSLPYSQLTGTPSTFSYPFPSNATSTKLDFSGGLQVGALAGFVGANNGTLYQIASSSADLPNTALQNSSFTINGQLFNLGDTHTITAASSTLLGDFDTFTHTITGSVSGNAGTATALAADGTNCSAGQAAAGVDASGNAQGCATYDTFGYPFPNGATTTLVSFNLASTSQLSVFQDAYFGGTATSTFDSTGRLTFGGNANLGANTLYGGSFGSGEYFAMNGAGGYTLTNGNNGWGINLASDYTRLTAGGAGEIELEFSTDNGISRQAAGVLDFGNGTYQDTSGSIRLAQASSTLQSITSKLYVGGTATTTIDSAGNIVIPSGSSLTNIGVANGCGTWSSGVLTTTGTACGSGGGGVASITATYPLASTGGTTPVISTNFGTTTNWGIANNGFLITSATGVPYVAASSTLDLPTSALASANISQFTNNSGYLTANQSITLSGDVSGSGATAITTAIGANKVTLGDIAQIGANTLLGNTTGATGNVTAISTSTLNIGGSAGNVVNAVTFNNGGAGGSSGSTFNGSGALTVSYNTIGAQVAGTYVTSVTGTYPIVSSGGTTPAISFTGLSTTSPWTAGQLAEVTANGKTIVGVSTSSISQGTGISISGTAAAVGSGALTITNTGVTSLGNGTGTTCSGTSPGTCNVNTSQNITTLSNLSTSGSVGNNGSGVLYDISTSSPSYQFGTYASSTDLTASGQIWDAGLTSGNCVQASTGGELTTTGSACGSGGLSGGIQGQVPYWTSASTLGNEATGTISQGTNISVSGGPGYVLGSGITVSLSGQVFVGNGGTGQSTFTSSQLLYGNGNANLSSVATTSTGVAGDILALNAAGQITLKDVAQNYSGILTPTRYLTMSWATTTTWTATTSGAYAAADSIAAPFSGTVQSIVCTASTTKSFLGIEPFVNGAHSTPSYLVASSTVGTTTLTGGNTFVRGQILSMYVGTTTNDPNAIAGECTWNITETI